MDKGTLIRKKEEQTLLGNLNKNICCGLYSDSYNTDRV